MNIIESSFKSRSFENIESLTQYLRKVQYYYYSSHASYDTVNDWFCLLKFILKSDILKVDTVFSHFPYNIIKGEEHKFILEMSGNKLIISIEKIGLIIEHKKPQQKDKYYDDMFEFRRVPESEIFDEIAPYEFAADPVLTNDVTILYSPIDKLEVDTLWADLCLKAIIRNDKTKNQIDILLIGDNNRVICLSDESDSKFINLSELISICPCYNYGFSIPSIFVESPRAIGIIRNRLKWDYKVHGFGYKLDRKLSSLIYDEPETHKT